jgi:hypothetical protein
VNRPRRDDRAVYFHEQAAAGQDDAAFPVKYDLRPEERYFEGRVVLIVSQHYVANPERKLIHRPRYRDPSRLMAPAPEILNERHHSGSFHRERHYFEPSSSGAAFSEKISGT